MMRSKQEIRKSTLQLRDEVSLEQRIRAEVLLTERILGHQWYYKAKTILLYMRHGSEIDPIQIMEDAFHKNKRVYLPKVIEDKMVFIRIQKGEKLEKGFFGILEPKLDEQSEIFTYKEEREDDVLMIMPGVAFDVLRNRIGYGKGFYDRYLSDKESMHTIAVGFDCQKVAMIESDENDIRPGQIICY